MKELTRMRRQEEGRKNLLSFFFFNLMKKKMKNVFPLLREISIAYILLLNVKANSSTSPFFYIKFRRTETPMRIHSSS
jgi:hypothetical protein